MRRHDLQDEAKAEENSAAPPAGLGEKISRLTDSDECIGGGACAAEACGETSALPALQQNGQHQNDAVYNEEYEKKRVKH
jgi:hypothetical protein